MISRAIIGLSRKCDFKPENRSQALSVSPIQSHLTRGQAVIKSGKNNRILAATAETFGSAAVFSPPRRSPLARPAPASWGLARLFERVIDHRKSPETQE